MNTRFVETFVLLAHIGSVRQVAKRMHSTPGAISMRVKKLEAQLNAVLFNWDHKTLQLTSDGLRLLPYAERLMESTQQLERMAKFPVKEKGKIRIGIIETVVHTFLPELMKVMNRMMADVTIDLSVELTTDLKIQLMRRDVDLLIRVKDDESDNPFAITRAIAEVPIHWIAHHRLIPPHDLVRNILSKQLLTQMRGSVPYESAVAIAQQLAAEQGLLPSELRISGTPSLATLVALAREGVGVAIMPGVLVKEPLERHELQELALPGSLPFQMAISYMKNASPLISDVAEIARKVCRNYCRHQGEHWIRFIE
ncbi:LysR family transcriptional regulator [Affinibrenneria salicis]|uniref:LysR family transcriptional regulator n=1 Tax=Affinibrenneria salicis TaxID=2590031 RepID=A0A5J5FRF6_9GAMM|nr:LysR family transcriptional regulator [Affinibrenneria salicis]KAA8995752.1 LysR family transcriptional regulator [Affinibrenneria salicis]